MVADADEWRTNAVPAPEQAAHAASFCHDQYQPGEAGYADPRQLQWWLVKDYPIAHLNDAPDADWFRSEQKMWADEGQPNPGWRRWRSAQGNNSQRA